MRVFLLTLMAASAVWFARRMRGSEIRKHGGWQLYPPTALIAIIAGLLLLTACNGNPIDPARRSQQAAQSGATGRVESAAERAEWERVLSVTSPPEPTHPPRSNDPNAAATVNAAVCVHNSSVTKDSTVAGCK